MNSEFFIIDLNYKNKIVDERRKDDPFDNVKMFDLLSTTIVDKRTLQMVEIHQLFKALDHTTTHVGSARLFHSLMTPDESFERIIARQESLMEMEANDKLRSAVAEFLGAYAAGEKWLLKLINAHMLPMLPYGDFRRAAKAVVNITKAAAAIPQPDTVYLDSLLKTIGSFKDTTAYDLMNRPAYRTFRGVWARSEHFPLSPALRFRPGRVSGGSIWPTLPCIFAGIGGIFGLLEPAVAESIAILTSGGILIGVLYGGAVKPMFDYETAILPIRKRLLDSAQFASAIESVALLDELVSFVDYCQELPHQTVIPEITNNPNHSFTAKGLKNPIAAKGNPDFVGNDVDLNGQKVTFITGPNSGGKTTYCKTIAQSQILGQVGGPVVAESATINVTDRISYQGPQFDSLTDQEGRFGTELKTTRDIFYNTTPKSLIILDEIAEGTTTHEKMSMSVEIMNGFFAKSNNTLLVTHSYELVENFMQTGKGQYLMVEFKGDDPTHRMVPGISKESQALRVAKKIGFAPDDIRRHLRENGYIA